MIKSIIGEQEDVMNRDNFKKVLEEQLDTIDQEQDRIIRISQINDQIAQLENQISELRKQAQDEMEGFVGDLAVSVRKVLPGINVSLNGGRCNVSHMSHNLSLRPDVTSRTWNVEPNKAGRRFTKHHGSSLGLSNDVNPLANGISTFFKKRYKKLNNEGAPPISRVSDKAGRTMGYK